MDFSCCETSPAFFPPSGSAESLLHSIEQREFMPTNVSGATNGVANYGEESNELDPRNAIPDQCAEHPPTTSLHEALASASQGNSILHRLYEAAALAPIGTTNSSDFAKVFGASTAQRLGEYGIEKISRSAQTSEVELLAPLHISDDNGSVDLETAVDYSASLDAQGKETLNNIHGVSATTGPFHVALNSIELQPREGGYLSALAKSDWVNARICATPDGSISHHIVRGFAAPLQKPLQQPLPQSLQ